MNKIFVIIATYNEKENIEKLIRQIFNLKIPNLGVIIIDDNSPDCTADIVENLKNEFASLYLIKRSGKLGLGTAIITGFKEAIAKGAEVMVTMDADFSHDPQKIPALLQSIEQGNDVVIGSRRVKGGGIVGWSPWRRFFSLAVMLSSKILLNIKTKDLSGDFRAYRRQIFEKINLDNFKSKGYSFVEEMIYYVEKNKFKVKEIPITFINRQQGQSKLSKKEIVSFLAIIIKLRFNNIKITSQKVVLFLLGISFFIGIWHAFPILSMIADEMYFVGGVLRAMESYSIFPLGIDVPYGILTYYLNYILIGFYLIVLLPFFSFNILDLKLFLVESPHLVYFMPRFLSAILAIFYLLIINKILKIEIRDIKLRLFLIILLFTNILTTLVLHTGKTWVFSMLLVLASFYYLYQALADQEITDLSRLQKNIFLSILLAFLAAANFPFNVFFLVNIPILIIYFRRRKPLILKIVKYSLISLVIFILIMLTNFTGTKHILISQFTNYHPLYESLCENCTNLSFVNSLLLYLKRMVLFFPLLLLTLLFAIGWKIKSKSRTFLRGSVQNTLCGINIKLRGKVRDKNLLIISLIYFIVYLLSVSYIANWLTTWYDLTRYSFLFGFFLILLISSFKIKFNKLFYLIGFISIIYWVFTLYYLSVPTTYNQAYDWTLNNINKEEVVIINNFNILNLPKNKQTYSRIQDYYCASKCKNVIKYDLNKDFKPLIIDKYSKEGVKSPNDSNVYYFTQTRQDQNGLELVASFTNNIKNKDIKSFDVDARTGNYFDLDFFRIKNFGPNIYIYHQQ